MKYISIPFDKCFYCGDPPEVKDHAFPLVRGAVLPDNMFSFVVPACRECNYLLSDEVWPTFGCRRKFVQTKLKKRYKRELAVPHWSSRELEELSPALREDIISAMRRKQWLVERVKWRLPREIESASTAMKLLKRRGPGRGFVAVHVGTVFTIRNVLPRARRLRNSQRLTETLKEKMRR